MKYRLPLLALCLIASQQATLADEFPGDLDSGFNTEARLDAGVNVVVPVAEEGVYIGGSFTTVRGTATSYIDQLNGDASADAGFNPGSGPNAELNAAIAQPDGKILIGGSFTNFNGTTLNRIARLNTDGSLDTSFNPGTGFNLPVDAMTLQPDGKILVSGRFTQYNGTSRTRIARLHANGNLDTNFAPSPNVAARIYSMVVLSDGKILIGGSFTSINGTTRNRIARLNSDGSLDTNFDPGAGPNSDINSIAILSDGKILIGGSFTSFDDTTLGRIARLNSDGSLDTSFGTGTGFNSRVKILEVLTDGKILAVGNFTSHNGTPRQYIARLNSDGSLDTGYNPGTGPDNWVNTLALQGDGKILIGGHFSNFSGAPRHRVARLNSDGSLDTDFAPTTSTTGTTQVLAALGGGKVFIAGTYSTTIFHDRNRVARLADNGQLDAAFAPGEAANDVVHALARQDDGKLLVGGRFTQFNGTTRNRIARVNSDGSLDAGFDPGEGANDWIYAVASQADGKTLIGGNFTSYNGTPRNRLARLNADGSLDTGFDTGSGADATVRVVHWQADGKVLIGGAFTSYNGTLRPRIARLNSDGSLDTSFNPGTGPDNWVDSIAVQADGRILIAGRFSSSHGVTRNRVARLNSDGSLDTSFNPGTGANDSVRSIVLQADGKTLIGGFFTRFNGITRNRIARLNHDGSLDLGFKPNDGPNDWVQHLALAADGRVLLGGDFTSYNNMPRNYVARLTNDPESRGSAFNLSSNLYVATDTATRLEVVIHRPVGDTEASVRIQSINVDTGSPFVQAQEGVDYEPIDAEIAFAAGETERTVELTLLPHVDAATYRHFRVVLLNPSEGMDVGSVRAADIRLLPLDTRAPSLTVIRPAANAKVVSLPYNQSILGTAGDNQGIDSVEIEYDGETYSAQFYDLEDVTTSLAWPWYFRFAPAASGPVSLTFTARDLSGNRTTIQRTFHYEKRETLTVACVNVSEIRPEQPGTAAMSALPAKSATLLPAVKLAGLPPPEEGPTWMVIAGTQITLTAKAKPGYVFDRWNNLPDDAVVNGTVATFAMPETDEDSLNIQAEFSLNPFTRGSFAELGKKPVFQGLLLADEVTPAGIATTGFLNAALVPAKGSLSGRLWLDGRVTAFTAVLLGDESVWFTAGRNLLPALSVNGRELSMHWSDDGLAMTLTGAGNETSTGLARPPLYSKNNPVGAALLDARGRQGYYTMGLYGWSQDPPLEPESFPQGIGVGGLTLTANGQFKWAGTLSEGTKFTTSGYLVSGDQAEFFVALPTPGGKTRRGSVMGTLIFDASEPASDVSGSGLQWFRPEAETKPGVAQAYRAGWPEGIALSTSGALYDGSRDLQTVLSLEASAPEGNAELSLQLGKLENAAKFVFNLAGNKPVKLDPKDKSWSLSLTPKTGLVRGVFTPNWPNPAKKLPAFNGIIQQKGSNAGAAGFYLSNQVGDLEPESGWFYIGPRQDP